MAERKPRVLVVDDSRISRREVCLALGDSFEIVEADNGLKALSLAKGQSFDLVLCDLNMPAMGGLELTRMLRSMPNYADTPIFAVTTESSDEMLRSGKAAGITAWIVKPVNPQLLARAVAKVVA